MNFNFHSSIIILGGTMQKLLEIPKDQSIQVSSKVFNFVKPDFIYIPILSPCQLLVKKNSLVTIGSPLYKTESLEVTSPISGIVQDIKEMNTLNGLTKSLVISNDFREKYLNNANFKNINKESLTKYFKEKLNLDLTHKTEIVLNCIDDEPYVLTETFYLFINYEGFLELLDKISQLCNLNITICVKSSNSESISKLLEYLGMYPNIKLKIIPNLYLLGKPNFLLKYLNLDENSTIVIKASNFYNIYNLIERKKATNTKFITITGNAIKNPLVANVKIGCKVEDIINSLINIEEEPIYIFNGLMSGNEKSLKDMIITPDLHSIFIMKPKEILKEEKCLNCGACLNICPANINPHLLHNPNYSAKAIEKCLKCGLCSYICPSHINFNKYFYGGENE